MNDNRFQGETAVNDGSTALTIISWLFGIVAFAIGVVNTFWGNDPGFGVFILLLSFVYFLPVNDILKKMTGFAIPKMRLIKILMGIFIIWAALGVGELFDKIELMMMDF
jgi:hypothetical protein